MWQKTGDSQSEKDKRNEQLMWLSGFDSSAVIIVAA